MQTRPFSNSPALVSKSRWLAYAAAGAASALAGSQAAEATIHYSGLLDQTVTSDGNHRVRLQLDQPGDSLVFVHRETMYQFDDEWAGFKAVGVVNASFRGLPDIDYHYVSKLEAGDFVSAGHFTHGNQNLSNLGLLAGQYSGSFTERGNAYVGFRFDHGMGVQYGWARVRMHGATKGNGFKILDYAYADPDEPIQVGQTAEDALASPALGSLGLLAAGATGLVAWRGSRTRRPGA